MKIMSSHVCSFAIYQVTFLMMCIAFCFNKSDIPLPSRGMVSVLEEGKRQYDVLQAKTRMPTLGYCWKNAVAKLHQGCYNFNDRVQSDVALNFANCFLMGAGHPSYNCDVEERVEREKCLKSMPDRAFNAYTEFFTHAQSMCFFIMSQVWHEETEKTIDKLSTSAADVARQLEASEELQEELLIHQKQSVSIQQELLSNGQTLGHMLHESRDSLSLMFNEFRSSTLEQQRLLSMVFHHLSALQSWIIGEVSWVDSIAFYVPSFALCFFLTSTQRTSSARIPGFIVLLVGGLVERSVARILLQGDKDAETFQPVDVVNEHLSWWVWLIRRSAIAINIITMAFLLYSYKDQEQLRHQLLLQIRDQNSELLEYIRQGKNSDKLRLHTVVGGMPVRNDETDSFGYMAVPTTPDERSFVATSSLHSSSNKAFIKPLPSRSDGIAQIRRDSNAGDISGIAVLHSPFRPIKEDVAESTTSENSVFPPRESSESRQTNITTGSSPLIGVNFSTEASPLTSTPREKRKGRRQAASINLSPCGARYNLRHNRTPQQSV